jgi:hypothetical protein
MCEGYSNVYNWLCRTSFLSTGYQQLLQGSQRGKSATFTPHGWLIDWLLLNVQQVVFQQDENMFNNT